VIVNGGIILLVKTGVISRKSWNSKNIVPLIGSIPYTKRQKLSKIENQGV
jgi:hypothetical protein